MFMCMLGRHAASTLLSVPKLSEGADRVGGQLRGDKVVSPNLAHFGGRCRKGMLRV